MAHTARRRRPLALIGWIAVQLAMIGFVGWLQPLMFAWGAAIAGFGWISYRF